MRYLVIHHSGSPNDTLEGIRDYHKPKYGRTYYNVVIDQDGITHTEHTKWNYRGIDKVSKDICLIGDYRTQKPTQKQIASLEVFIYNLKNTYKLSDPIPHKEAHKYMEATKSECPGKLMEYMTKQSLQKEYDIYFYYSGKRSHEDIEKFINENSDYYSPATKINSHIIYDQNKRVVFDYNTKYGLSPNPYYVKEDGKKVYVLVDEEDWKPQNASMYGIAYEYEKIDVAFSMVAERDWDRYGRNVTLNTLLHETRHMLLDREEDDTHSIIKAHDAEHEHGWKYPIDYLQNLIINKEDMRLNLEILELFYKNEYLPLDEETKAYWLGKKDDGTYFKVQDLIEQRIKDKQKMLR